MDKIIVTGLGKPLDGTYEVDLLQMVQPGFPESLTGTEMHYVKVKSQVRGAELLEALGAWDNDLILALAAIAARRAGKRFDDERLWEMPIGAVTLEVGTRDVEDEDDAGPPAGQPSAETDKPSTSGGESSPKTSAHPANGQSPTGAHDSGKSADFDLPISAV